MFNLKKNFDKCPPVLIYTPISKVLEYSSYFTLVSMSSSRSILGPVTFNEEVKMSPYRSKMETAFRNFHFHFRCTLLLSFHPA